MAHKGVFQPILKVARRELCKVAKEPVYQAILIYLPALSFLFFVLFFEQGVARNIPIAVVDNDHTSSSRKMITMIDATPAAMVSYECNNITEAEALMFEGRASAVVVVERGFESAILGGMQARVGNYISGVNISVNGLLSRDIQAAVETFAAGVELQRLVAEGLTREQAMAQILPIRTEQHVLFNPYTNYGYYLMPAFMPMMLLLFTLCSTIFSIGVELKNSTAQEWLATADDSIVSALAGKLLPITMAMMLAAMVMFWVMFAVVGVPLNGSLVLLSIATLLLISAYEAIGVAFIALLCNMRLALSLGGGYAVMAFTFSGITFPIMAMYPAMQYMSRLFPLSFYSNLFIDQAMRGAPISYSLVDIGSLALFMVLIPITLPRLKRVCADARYWGRI